MKPNPRPIAKQEAAQELVKRRDMRESLLAFAQHIEIPGAPVDDKALTTEEIIFNPVETGIADHHVVLMNALEECMTTDYGRLMIFMPPGAAKSTYATVLAPTWKMGRDPGTQIILASYNTELAKKQGSRARSIIGQMSYRSAFQAGIRSDTTAKEMWALTNGSEYMSAGMMSGITGNRADGVIIDDPVKGRRDSKSPAIQAATMEAFDDDVKTRLKPKAFIVVIQTRWDPNDLSGNILPDDWNGESGRIRGKDGMMWNVLCLVAKIENEHQEKHDPLGRKIGEYLWPEWFDDKHWYQFEPRLEDPKGPSKVSWESLFQQNPKPVSGNQFEEGWFNRYEVGKQPRWLMLFSSSDYAVTSKDEDRRGDPDFTEHGIGGLDQNADLWLVDWWFGQEETDHTIQALIDICKKWNVKRGFGEVGIIRRAIEPYFKMLQKQQRYRVRIEYLAHIGDKKANISSFRSMAMNGKVWIPNCPWGDRLIEMLCAFPSPAVHDDGPDVCALFGRGLMDMKWSRAKVTKPRKKGVTFGSVEWLHMDTESTEDHPGAMM